MTVGCRVVFCSVSRLCVCPSISQNDLIYCNWRPKRSTVVLRLPPLHVWPWKAKVQDQGRENAETVFGSNSIANGPIYTEKRPVF